MVEYISLIIGLAIGIILTIIFILITRLFRKKVKLETLQKMVETSYKNLCDIQILLNQSANIQKELYKTFQEIK